MNSPDEPRGPQPPREKPLHWREIALLIGSFVAALLLAGLVVLLLAHFFL